MLYIWGLLDSHYTQLLICHCHLMSEGWINLRDPAGIEPATFRYPSQCCQNFANFPSLYKYKYIGTILTLSDTSELVWPQFQWSQDSEFVWSQFLNRSASTIMTACSSTVLNGVKLSVAISALSWILYTGTSFYINCLNALY